MMIGSCREGGPRPACLRVRAYLSACELHEYVCEYVCESAGVCVQVRDTVQGNDGLTSYPGRKRSRLLSSRSLTSCGKPVMKMVRTSSGFTPMPGGGAPKGGGAP
eukprot:1161761-Pelagomonas_calceolata.AAC.16